MMLNCSYRDGRDAKALSDSCLPGSKQCAAAIVVVAVLCCVRSGKKQFTENDKGTVK